MSTEFVRFKTIFQIIVTMAPSVIKTKYILFQINMLKTTVLSETLFHTPMFVMKHTHNVEPLCDVTVIFT